MKATIHLKGGEGSGDFGHAGIPGHQGGSQAQSGGSSPVGNKYSSMNFKDAAAAVIKDVKAGIFDDGWHMVNDDIAKITLPEGGIAKIAKFNDRYVTGGKVGGTAKQQGNKLLVSLRTYRPSTTVPDTMERWSAEDLWQMKTKYEGLAAKRISQDKAFAKIVKGIRQ